jgi:hypothetical protein
VLGGYGQASLSRNGMQNGTLFRQFFKLANHCCQSISHYLAGISPPYKNPVQSLPW